MNGVHPQTRRRPKPSTAGGTSVAVEPVMSGAPPNRSLRDWSLADQVYEAILTRIIEGQYPVNLKLPAETALAEEMSVSRPVLRQALKQLREDGIINSRQGSGSFVRKRPERAVLNFAPVGSIADIQRTYEFRITVEGDAAALAAERWTDEDMARIRDALAELDRCIAGGRLGAEADEAFHLSICAATHNHYYVSARSSMKSQILAGMNLARSLSLTKPAERLRLVQDEHLEILDCLERRDAKAAGSAMRAHVEKARSRVFEGTERAETQ